MQELSVRKARRPSGAAFAWAILAFAAAAVLLRVLRLDWQPLWWDEGYSIYFATEPLGRMGWLTANDIHPPLYYALLHIWLRLTGDMPIPEAGRLLSVLSGALALPLQFALARAMFPHSRRPAVLALLLLAFSPIHLYYSQEVRMYGMALALGLAASLALWHWVECVTSAPQASPPAHTRRQTAVYQATYLLAGLAALYTLYYAALLLAAHALWAGVRLRKNLRALLGLLGVYLLMFLLYLPWLLYAVPQLIDYVGGKVQSDQDIALGPLAYVERHLVAFTAGHVQWAALPNEWAALAPATFAICAIILGLVLRQTLIRRLSTRAGTPDSVSSQAASALWTWLIVPVLLGWLINLRLPFFPEGGERLLLIVLPYFLLLIGLGLDRTWQMAHLGKLAAVALVLNALVGIAAFYTTPRYAADDYRPLLRQVQQQGADGSTLLAIFPWQVGYWRAYAPPDANAGSGTQPLLLSDKAAAWSPAVAAAINRALEGGTVWFPEPLTFGSSLPAEIEQYLAERAVNVENRWYDATRLTAWSKLPAPTAQPIDADFGLMRLQQAGIAPAFAAAANEVVAAMLEWAAPTAGDEPAQDEQGQDEQAQAVNVSLRLQDAAGHVWASREYGRDLPQAGTTINETVGLIVPYGLPPGGYEVRVSVQSAEGEPLTIAGSDAVAAAVGRLEVTQPQTWPSAMRLPVQRALERPSVSEGLSLLGYSGPTHEEAMLAGTELGVTLFLTNQTGEPPERQIYLSLLDSAGAGVAGYEGWPLPAYPTGSWPQGALVQVPAAFYLPGSLTSGDYRLVAGLLDPATGSKTPPAEVATIAVQQRTAGFTRPTPSQPMTGAPQLGTHARLLGYDLAQQAGGQTALTLYWEILQPLLPPHHIFVHLDTADGETRAQQDGPPATAAGPAPTGSWQPGEFLKTEHLLTAAPAAGDLLRVGLYDPKTQVRLPVTVDGQAAGDSVTLPAGER